MCICTTCNNKECACANCKRNCDANNAECELDGFTVDCSEYKEMEEK